jgi:hypothetical protein
MGASYTKQTAEFYSRVDRVREYIKSRPGETLISDDIQAACNISRWSVLSCCEKLARDGVVLIKKTGSRNYYKFRQDFTDDMLYRYMQGAKKVCAGM